MSPGGREMATSGGEREELDITTPLRNGFQTFPRVQQGKRQSGGGVAGGMGGGRPM